MIGINLLPPEQKKRIKMMVLYRNIISSGLILFLIFLLLTVFLTGVLTFLNLRYLAYEKNINDRQSMVIHTETIKTMQSRINNLNDNLSAIKKIEDGKSDVYGLLDKISNELFTGVKVYSLEINKESRLVTVSGFAALRANLVAIRDKINSSSDYKEADFPLSNLANPANINFRFSFTYNF